MADAGRPSRERAALVDDVEDRLFELGDYKHFCSVMRRRIVVALKAVDDMEAELTLRRHHFARFAAAHGYPHIAPELLAPENEETAGDAAASDTEFLEELSA